jgi:hypothetical protein
MTRADAEALLGSYINGSALSRKLYRRCRVGTDAWAEWEAAAVAASAAYERVIAALMAAEPEGGDDNA